MLCEVHGSSQREGIPESEDRHCQKPSSFKNAFNPSHAYTIWPQYTVVDFILQTKCRGRGGRVITAIAL